MSFVGGGDDDAGGNAAGTPRAELTPDGDVDRTAALDTKVTTFDDEATTVGRFYWYTSAKAHELGYAERPARATVASSLAWLAVSPDLPRWAREGLRLHPEVRAARELVAAPLADDEEVSPRPRRSPPAWPRRPR